MDGRVVVRDAYGYWVFNFKYWLLVIDYWTLDDGRWTMDTSDGIENLSINSDDSGTDMGMGMGMYHCVTVLLYYF